jgi:hypothetical protein
VSVRDADATGPLAEARWFVAGDLPAALRPGRRGRRRVDSYCVQSLSPASSIKRRGGGSLEWKVRLGRVELVRFGEAVGFAERWVKLQLDELSPALAGGPWFDVAKQIWCVDDGVEVTRLSVAGDRWWTVAVRTEADVSTDRARLRSLVAALSAAGTAHSYASWLSERWGDPSVRRRAA